MITFVNIIYQSQKLRRSKQRIRIFDARESGKKIFRSFEKISRLCASSVVVVCATKRRRHKYGKKTGKR